MLSIFFHCLVFNFLSVQDLLLNLFKNVVFRWKDRLDPKLIANKTYDHSAHESIVSSSNSPLTHHLIFIICSYMGISC